MATLKNNGTELLRIEYPGSRVSYRSNGKILRDSGFGWKQFKQLKSDVNPIAHADKIRARHAENLAKNPARAEFEKAVFSLGSFKVRVAFMTCLSLLGPGEPDGITIELNDHWLRYSGNEVTLDEIAEICEAARIYETTPRPV